MDVRVKEEPLGLDVKLESVDEDIFLNAEEPISEATVKEELHNESETEDGNKRETDNIYNRVKPEITHEIQIKDEEPVAATPDNHTCRVCRFETASRAGLTIHVNAHLRGTFDCHICGYQGRSEYYLRKHMHTHSGDKKPHCCEICGYTTGWVHLMKNHMYLHGGEKPHLAIHNAEKIFKCDMCKYIGIKKVYLKRHMVVHGGETNAGNENRLTDRPVKI